MNQHELFLLCGLCPGMHLMPQDQSVDDCVWMHRLAVEELNRYPKNHYSIAAYYSKKMDWYFLISLQ